MTPKTEPALKHQVPEDNDSSGGGERSYGKKDLSQFSDPEAGHGVDPDHFDLIPEWLCWADRSG